MASSAEVAPGGTGSGQLATALVCLGLAELAGAVALAPGFGLAVGLDPTHSPSAGLAAGVAASTGVVAFGCALATGAVAAAWGLGAGRPWAPALALAVSLAAVPSACGPGALVVLVLLSARRNARERVAPHAGDEGGAAPPSAEQTTRALEES